MHSHDSYSCSYLPSYGVIVKIVLGNLDLLFEGNKFQTLIYLKRFEHAQKCTGRLPLILISVIEEQQLLTWTYQFCVKQDDSSTPEVCYQRLHHDNVRVITTLAVYTCTDQLLRKSVDVADSVFGHCGGIWRSAFRRSNGDRGRRSV